MHQNKGANGSCFGIVELCENAIMIRGPDLRDAVDGGLLGACGVGGGRGAVAVRSLVLPLPPAK